MATVKGKTNDANSGTTAKTTGLADGKNGAAGKAGSAAKPPGPVAGPGASEPVNNGNGGASLGPEKIGNVDNGDQQAARDAAADAPEQSKPGKRGRHPNTCTCATCIATRAAKPEAPRKGVVIGPTPQKWVSNIFGFHRMIGQGIPIPDITKIAPGTAIGPDTPMLAYVTMEEAQRLADASYAVAVEYDLIKYFQGKTPVLVTMLATAGFIYYPKIQALRLLLAMQKAAQKAQQAPTAASAFEAAPPQTPANDGNRGAYKYGP